MITRRLAYLLIPLCLTPMIGWTATPLRGLLLYENSCHHCHLAEIHYRINSRVDSWAGLRRLIDIWQEEMGLGWTEEDVTDVALWLNHAFYRLSDAPTAPSR
jgi:hypothetical protein